MDAMASKPAQVNQTRLSYPKSQSAKKWTVPKLKSTHLTWSQSKHFDIAAGLRAVTGAAVPSRSPDKTQEDQKQNAIYIEYIIRHFGGV